MIDGIIFTFAAYDRCILVKIIGRGQVRAGQGPDQYGNLSSCVRSGIFYAFASITALIGPDPPLRIALESFSYSRASHMPPLCILFLVTCRYSKLQNSSIASFQVSDSDIVK